MQNYIVNRIGGKKIQQHDSVKFRSWSKGLDIRPRTESFNRTIEQTHASIYQGIYISNKV